MSRVGIIGSGVAGLSAIRSLKSKGIPCVAFEKANNLGGVWRDNYLGSGLQVGNEMYHFPDFEFPRSKAEGYATRQEVQTYVENFAHKLSLESQIQYNSEVTKAEQQYDGSWLLTLQGQGEKQHVSSLIVCTGMYNKPKLPHGDKFSKFAGKVMHSTEVKQGEDFAGKRVVVVGGGKSAMDVATSIKQDLGAKSCTVLSRRAHWMTPPKVLNLIPFEYIFLSRMGQMLVDLHVGFWPSTNTSTTQNGGYAVMRPVFKLVEAILALQYGFKRGTYYPSADVAADLYLCANVASSKEFKSRLRAGVFQLKVGEVDTCVGNKLTLKQQQGELDCDVVVCATGFDKSYDVFDEITKSRLQVESDGLYLYRKIVPPQVEGLFFCGSESTFIYNICGSALQAEWIARVLQGEIALPSKDVMQNEVERSKLWARSWIPEHGQRSNQVMLHQIHAWDDLLRDMGVNPKRKSNRLAEFFMPYLPRDYNGIIKQQQ